ncbi:MAG: protein translocase subunit SecF [Chloroflexi bacterium]|nr:protein translocase subunit SecF [Chloroflexota bacterium]
MFSFAQKRYWYFLITLIILIPGIVSLAVNGLKPSIDFTGGAALELRFEKPVFPSEVRDVFVDAGYTDTSATNVGDDKTVLIRMKQVDEETKAQLVKKVEERFGPVTELYFRSVGPSVGKEVTRSAFTAIGFTALAIVAFILLAFRKVPNAFRYGVCAVVAIAQNILVVTGLFSILGAVLGWEVDALFLTALLTVIGFSVQDIIVVFDRIRENIPRRRGEDYETIVNRSVLETLHRSLATQLNAMFVLLALLLFGGATIKQFVLVMLVGMLSETYASLFTAVPLLVVWEKGEIGGFFRRLFRGRPATA